MYDNIPVGVNAIIVRNGFVLLGKRGKNPKKGYWSTIGGFVNIGESLEEALIREIKEEIDCNVISLKYFCSTPQLYNGRQTLDVYFIVEIDGNPSLSDEVTEVIWVDKPIKPMFSRIMSNIIIKVLRT
jgi:ADP-ribose pyrophosphatase YjhB (NUDIX family)